ncbi:CDP-glucose 4,6-dehydratase [uncultured Desulfobacter sp.]|uniref:CDP-glucose 4,6-dehydratase n=1 Tax=uncultured Desulfobacter sp. TaxID=240139 RepID=UPI002AAA78C3|nr:CDP-glucose 4,6-dehydratase [uncultured Desulfobacter sp.]
MKVGTKLFSNSYDGKKILITGDTGFKGSWLVSWLLELGAEVYGLSNGIVSMPSHFDIAGLHNHIRHFDIDIRDLSKVERAIRQIKPDFVFHLAAQALVRLSYQDPITTLTTNILGTANVLESLRHLENACTGVIITSDKCYDNVEWTWGYRETDALGGKDPYSASKGAAELLIRTYAASFFADKNSGVKIAAARAGNVIGGGDWAQDRIVPDCMKAWSKNERVEIRNPNSTRPWQHVLEPLSGYLLLGKFLDGDSSLNGEAFNFGPSSNQNYTVGELITEMQNNWENAEWKDTSMDSDSVHESGMLKLCCDKALHLLEWEPVLSFDETVELTVEWYKKYYDYPENVFMTTRDQLNKYVDMAIKRGLSWTRN